MHNIYFTSIVAIKRIEGKLLTLVETLGLPQSQEKAVKDQVRQTIWSLDKVLIIEEKILEHLRKIQETRYPAESVMSLEELGYDE